MRDNQPVTGREVEFGDDEIIVSQTDLKGRILSVNRTFVRVSGFTEAELIGQPHNLVRHPDMPPAAYEDFWRTLKAGRPWVGLVKNRCKNGDHYWVEAHVTPEFDADHRVVGYLSVRRKPTRAQVAEAERIYALFRNGRQGSLRIEQGRVVSHSLLRRLNPLWLLSLRQRLLLAAAGVGALGLALILLGDSPLRLWLLAAATAFAFYSAWWLGGDISGRVQLALHAFRRIAGGRYDNPLPVDRGDSIGRMLMGLQCMQTKLGYEVQEQSMRAAENARVLAALEAADTNIMLANADHTIIYANSALKQMFAEAEADLRSALPAFRAAEVVGSHIDVFHREPAHQRGLLEALREPHRTRLRIAGRIFDLVATPVFAPDGSRAGTVTEWRDRTAEILVEESVAEVVAAAAAGDFSRRIPLEGKTGFVRRVAESIDRLMDSTSSSLDAVREVLLALA